MQPTTEILQLENTNSNLFLKAIDDLFKKTVQEIHPPTPPEIEFITRKNVSEIFGISLVTVHAWTNHGILKAYKIANKTRFKKHEVLAACKPLKHEK